MTATEQAVRPVRVLSCVLALCAGATAGCDTCTDECTWGAWRCDENHVQMCMSGPYDEDCGSSLTYWVTVDSCSGKVCTTEGCADVGACFVAP